MKRETAAGSSVPRGNKKTVFIPGEFLMSRVRSVSLAITASIGIALAWAPVAMAQTAAPDVAASTSKEAKKAQRKAARAKKNAELKELEKQGYQPGGDQLNYPQNIQDAQRKVDASKAAKGMPASAP
jgi:hypothetical protein